MISTARSLFVMVGLVGCSGTQHDLDASVDAATSDAASEASGCGICTATLDSYCQQGGICPASVSEAVAVLCFDPTDSGTASQRIISVCGDVVLSGDGFGYIFDGGTLVEFVNRQNGELCCVAGPLGDDVSKIVCSNTATCADAGF